VPTHATNQTNTPAMQYLNNLLGNVIVFVGSRGGLGNMAVKSPDKCINRVAEEKTPNDGIEH
jgi:hypothetical protein